ncbi:MAG: hypothetical protein ACYTG0_42125, partial [Planctomycetota bacterium]
MDRKDPGVEAILATNPSTPRQWTRAAKILSDLGRPDLARGFLKQVLDANLDQQQLVALEESFGPGMFARLADRRDLAPEAQQLTDAVLAAVSGHVKDPARVATAIDALDDPSAEARAEAMVRLEQAGDTAAAPLIAVLGDAGRVAQHAAARAALVRLGPDAVGPAAAALEA